jgi:hypothetical protein
MEVVKDHLCSHLREGDRPSELHTSCEDEAQHEGVHAASDPPTDRFGDGTRMGVSSANEHVLPQLRRWLHASSDSFKSGRDILHPPTPIGDARARFLNTEL